MRRPRPERIVVALGGNALLRPGEEPTLAAQVGNARRAMRAVVPLIGEGHHVVLTHGNGFQVGSILVRVEEALGKAYAIPLEMCVAESQGEIGYLLEQSLQNALTKAGLDKPVVSLLTQVVVDRRDPAFRHPTKPIGPAYTRRKAEELRSHGFPVVRQGRGWRRVVASPRPLEIDDAKTIAALLQRDVVVIAAGGGGVPVVRRKDGALEGVPAVIDKDLASSVLAGAIGAQRLIILTGERAVFRDYGTPKQRRLPRLTPQEARRELAAGQFPPGSMGPKVQAAVEFVERGGRSALITSAAWLSRARAGRGGTLLTRKGGAR